MESIEQYLGVQVSQTQIKICLVPTKLVHIMKMKKSPIVIQRNWYNVDAIFDF